MKLSRVGIDLAKNVFQVHGVNEQGELVWKRSLKRATWLGVLFKTVEPLRSRYGSLYRRTPLGKSAPGERLSSEVDPTAVR